MNDSQCVQFMQWALPKLGMRWRGFRRVRRQVCRRLGRRLCELGLSDFAAYREYVQGHPEEWAALERLTRITISRFHRDRGVFAVLEWSVLPGLAADAIARGAEALEAWSAGCASGEEAYTLAIAWQLELAPRFPELGVRILATDVDDAVLARALGGCYGASSVRELPERWRARAFIERDRLYCLRDEFKQVVRIDRHDIRCPPPGRFDLVMCRNLAFTYFDLDPQRTTSQRPAGALRPRGALVLGAHEALPSDVRDFERWSSSGPIYRRREPGASG